MHFLLKKHVGSAFVVVDVFEDHGSINDRLVKAKADDPHGAFIVEKIHTPKTQIVVAKPKRSKGAN